jgi:Fe-coproporphyrin III synthase
VLSQIHPLEQVGRAAECLEGAQPDELESAYAYLEVERIRQEYAGRIAIQFDLIHSAVLREQPHLFFDEGKTLERTLGELVSPLVVEDDGRVVPFGYGFAGRYALGFLTRASLQELAAAWRTTGYRALQNLCRATFQDAVQQRELPILNWWERLGEHAARSSSS